MEPGHGFSGVNVLAQILQALLDRISAVERRLSAAEQMIAIIGAGRTGSPGTPAVTPGAATNIVITTQPSGSVSGVALTTQPVVEIRDANGLKVTAGAYTVGASILSGNGSTSNHSVTTSAGVGTFTSFTVTGSGAQVVRFSAAGLSSADSASFTVGAGSTHLSFSTQPSGAVSGVAFTGQPVVQVLDAGNALVTVGAPATAPITMAILSGSGSLSGTTTVNAVGGVATFTNLKITGSGSFTIQATSSGITLANSSSFSVAAFGSATQLGMGVQPSGAVSGVAISPSVTIQVLDANNNVVTTDTSNVVASLATGSGALSGTTTVAAIAGVATFSNLIYTGAGPATIRFSDGALTTVTSQNIFTTSSAWPNSPLTLGVSGATLVNDYGFADPVPASTDAVYTGSGGWHVQNGYGFGSASGADTVTVGDAPLSPTKVLRLFYANGVNLGGGSPATFYYFMTATRKFYWGIKWKCSSPWSASPEKEITKIIYITPGGGNSLYLGLHENEGIGSPFIGGSLEMSSDDRNLPPNVGSGTVVYDTWYTIEWYMDLGTADGVTADGIYRWWVNGALVGNYTNVKFPTGSTFTEPHIYGGYGIVAPPQDQWFYYDHSHIELVP